MEQIKINLKSVEEQVKGENKYIIEIVNNSKKYMWHFWDDQEFGKLKVIGTHESNEVQISVYEGEIGGTNNGADKQAPSNMSLAKSGMWKLDVYIGENLFGTVFVKVHNE